MGGGGGGTGGSTGAGSGPNTGGLPPMGGETLGFPNWFPFPHQNPWDLLPPGRMQCDFGVCVPIGTGFTATGRPANPALYQSLRTLYAYADIVFGGDLGPPRLRRGAPVSVCGTYSECGRPDLARYCTGAGAGPWARCVRGCLLEQFNCGTGKYDDPLWNKYGPFWHGGCFVGCLPSDPN
jgi:hypothetical protein